MAREIKFRAWDSVHKVMITPYCELRDGYFWGEDCTNTGISVNHEDVMQYIGRKDVNGFELYEKDICKILYTDWPSKSNDDTRTIEQYMDDIAHIGVIEYVDEGFYFKTKDRNGDDNYSHINPGTHGFVKVIGNIYENPELLTK